MFKHILLAADGSPAGEQATTVALDLVRQLHARLTAVHVIDPYPYLGVGELNPAGFQAYMADAYRRAGEALDRVVAQGAQAAEPVEVGVQIIEDMATPAGILQAAADLHADLLVVGSHGRSGVVRLVLGSVAAKVLAASPIPVLVARAHSA